MEYRVCRNNPAPYNDLNGKISLLGLGTMRLPLRDAADQTSIDEEKAQEIFDYAYAHGVNYFDTAYPYHGGQSEPFVGRVIAKWPRESFYLATKMPLWQCGSLEEAQHIFEEQLRRLGVEYIDFYLAALPARRPVRPGPRKWASWTGCGSRKMLGRIRNFGFSCHDNAAGP